jgi:hypothetical protein
MPFSVGVSRSFSRGSEVNQAIIARIIPATKLRVTAV